MAQVCDSKKRACVGTYNVLAIIGAVMIIVGAFLDWFTTTVTVEGFTFTIGINWQGMTITPTIPGFEIPGEVAQYMLYFALGLVAFGATILILAILKKSKSVIIEGAILLVTLLIVWLYLLPQLIPAEVTLIFNPGLGFYLLIAGSIMAIIGGIWTLVSDEAKEGFEKKKKK